MAKLKVSSTFRLPSIQRIRKLTEHTGVITDQIGQELVDELHKNIDRQGIWERWTPLAESTVYKRRTFGKSPADRALAAMKQHVKYRAAGTQVTVFVDSPYSELHEEGRTGPWLIAPKNKKWLKFPFPASSFRGGVKVQKVDIYQKVGKSGRRKKVGTSAGAFVYAKQVQHPGYPARRLMIPRDEGLLVARKVVERFFRRAAGL